MTRRAPATFLTLDLGNSRLKLRLWELTEATSGSPWSAEGAVFDGEDIAAGFEDWLTACERLEGAALSSVAADELTERVRDLLSECVPGFVRDPDPGLEIRAREPGEVGCDRLFAARGALVLAGRSAIVVDAGTALTVDAVEHRRGTAPDAFLGGAIAPGPALQARALATGAARLPEVEPCPGPEALGRTTEEAIQAGIGVGFRGAARELVHGVAAAADLEGAPVVLTGGARSFLLEPEPIVSGEVVVHPELVHLGLLTAALRSREGP